MGEAGPSAGKGPSGAGVVRTTPGAKAVGAGGRRRRNVLIWKHLPLDVHWAGGKGPAGRELPPLVWTGRRCPDCSDPAGDTQLRLALRRCHTDPTGGSLSRVTDQ